MFDADLKGYFDSIPRDTLLSAIRMRVTDSSVLKRIRLWLDAPVVDERDGGPPRRSEKGTPQGGVISPLLANIDLHWFDRFFHAPDGPVHWARARLVRYADDFVVLAVYQGGRLREWIRATLEDRMGLQLHPGKTRVVRMLEPKSSLDFLGFTFRYVRSPMGYERPCLQVSPSKKALVKARAALREMTSHRYGFMAVSTLIERVNRQTRGWAGYFRYGYWSKAMHSINHDLFARMKKHLQRRSQRPFRPPEGGTYYPCLRKLGLDRVSLGAACMPMEKRLGPPDAGNPHVRWEEGPGAHRLVMRPGLLDREPFFGSFGDTPYMGDAVDACGRYFSDRVTSVSPLSLSVGESMRCPRGRGPARGARVGVSNTSGCALAGRTFVMSLVHGLSTATSLQIGAVRRSSILPPHLRQ